MSNNNNKVAQEGWTIMTEVLGGDELVWRVEDGGTWMPEIYENKVDAMKAIAQHQIEILQEFIDDERDEEETDWSPTVYAARIVIYEDGELMVYDGAEDSPQPILETTLSDWRANA
jgi:hypothetical protein